jgi:hypothetical protein
MRQIAASLAAIALIVLSSCSDSSTTQPEPENPQSVYIARVVGEYEANGACLKLSLKSDMTYRLYCEQDSSDWERGVWDIWYDELVFTPRIRERSVCGSDFLIERATWSDQVPGFNDVVRITYLPCSTYVQRNLR